MISNKIFLITSVVGLLMTLNYFVTNSHIRNKLTKMISNKIFSIIRIVGLLLTLNYFLTNFSIRNNVLRKSSENGYLSVVKFLVRLGADIHFDNDCALRITTVSKGPGRCFAFKNL